MKKLINLFILLILLTGCSTTDDEKTVELVAPKPLAVLAIPEDEELIIDIRDEFDPNSIITDVKEGSEVSYKLDEVNSKIVITIKNEDKVETLEKTVNIQYPLGEFKEEDITIDTYTGYDVNDLVDVSEGTEVTEEFDEENGKLKITLTNGDRTEVIEKDVEVVNSNPFPVHWECKSIAANIWASYEIYEDGTANLVYSTPSGPYARYTAYWTGDLKNGTIGGSSYTLSDGTPGVDPMYRYYTNVDGTITKNGDDNFSTFVCENSYR